MTWSALMAQGILVPDEARPDAAVRRFSDAALARMDWSWAGTERLAETLRLLHDLDGDRDPSRDGGW